MTGGTDGRIHAQTGEGGTSALTNYGVGIISALVVIWPSKCLKSLASPAVHFKQQVHSFGETRLKRAQSGCSAPLAVHSLSCQRLQFRAVCWASVESENGFNEAAGGGSVRLFGLSPSTKPP